MTSTTAAPIAPLAVRGLMPDNYLKLIQDQLGRKKTRVYSDSVISDVVRSARTTHPIWPIVLKLAQTEKLRRDEETRLNEEYLRSLEQKK
ncbi:hypothetical protein [Hymenobacter sp. YC55]|uniref:hypothetical protein n=1 Tax=Hymenobacter sp. YC55 TaxID=3034019 RepID=UPI0023F6C668|nr:hypothetical protein [Hymenobacter sp. YC55]MDF7810476.1 hypothetical protein [Hymenobacter sp. YC55]